MITEIAAVASSLKAAGDMAKAAIDLRDVELMRGKVSEMLGEIISAHQSALAAVIAQSALIDRVRELEAKIAEFENWTRERDRYELTQLEGRGPVFVYAIKPSAQGTEPFHAICPKCYEDGKKAIIQASAEIHLGVRVYKCHRCNSSFLLSKLARRDDT